MKDLKIYLFAASLLLVIYLVAEYNKPKEVDWAVTYNKTDKIPFGTYVLYNRLHDIFQKAEIHSYREPFYNVITDDSIKNSTYLVICNKISINEYDYNKLTQYIGKGNDVFITSNYFGGFLQSKLHVETSSEFQGNGLTTINFVSKYLPRSTYLVDRNSTNGYFNKFDTLKTTVLGKNAYNHVNYIKIKIGKGALYLNANPLMFTNYSLLQNQGAAYAATALSYLKTDKGLVWDEYYTKGREGDDSSMRVFLSHPPLRWTFYIVVFSLVAFVLYQMKRRQRIIPIIEPLTNTSVDFATVVGQVYYEQHNNSNIAQKKASYFLEHIRMRYNLKTNVQNDDFMKTLAQKSGVTLTLIKAIFYQVAIVQDGQPINNTELIALNQNIEQFYLQSS